MPVDWSRYPRDWKAISLRIRQRDHWRCRFCGVPNAARGWRDGQGRFHPLHPWEALPAGRRETRIVLTVAHLGASHPDGRPGNVHDKYDVRDENLASLCQACHLWIDIEEHMQNARASRQRRQQAARDAEGFMQVTFGEGD